MNRTAAISSKHFFYFKAKRQISLLTEIAPEKESLFQ